MPPSALSRLFSRNSTIKSVDGSINSTLCPSKVESLNGSTNTTLGESKGASSTDKFGLFRLDSGNGPDLEENPTTASRKRKVDFVPYTADVIAIHGLGGTAHKTWTHENGVLWLRDIAPNEFPGARIYSFGYDSGFAFSKGTGTLRDFAKSLLEAIKLERTKSEVHFYSDLLFYLLTQSSLDSDR